LELRLELRLELERLLLKELNEEELLDVEKLELLLPG
jgi:hypothetical protein